MPDPDFEVQLLVERLHARYCHALDEDRLEDWPNFFTEKAARHRAASPSATRKPTLWRVRA